MIFGKSLYLTHDRFLEMNASISDACSARTYVYSWQLLEKVSP